MAEADATWEQVLDELEARLLRMESGELAALVGWTAPASRPTAMTAPERARAQELVDRQHALTATLRERQGRLVASRRATRRSTFLRDGRMPVYVDRLA